jgi:hypothetical protein
MRTTTLALLLLASALSVPAASADGVCSIFRPEPSGPGCVIADTAVGLGGEAVGHGEAIVGEAEAAADEAYVAAKVIVGSVQDIVGNAACAVVELATDRECA